ncbi:hypothetical protein Droror1_Dr00006633 [Drosera rotundifolia]
MIMGLSEKLNHEEMSGNGLHVGRHIPFQSSSKSMSPWFDLRVFYVRVSNFVVDDSTPEWLALNHIPLNPDTLLEVNGSRCGIHSDGMTSLLRRDRVDKKSREATFVSTDSIRFTGSVKFEVLNKEEPVLSGVLEMCSSNGSIGEMKDGGKQWSLNCESEIVTGSGFLTGKQNREPEYATPAIEVYVAGSFSGAPIILSKTLQLNTRKKLNRLSMNNLHAIAEDESAENGDVPGGSSSPNALDLQVVDYGRRYKTDDKDNLVEDAYWRRGDYIEGEDGELSWFNAGVRVGVGIGLGVCLGVGIGVGLLVRTYQSTARNFRRRLL